MKGTIESRLFQSVISNIKILICFEMGSLKIVNQRESIM